MCNCPSLGQANRSIWASGAADPPVIGQTLCSLRQDRYRRCRGGLQGGRAAEHFVPVKSTDQQAALLHHRARDLLVRQRTMLINAVGSHLGEFGTIAPAGRHRVADMVNLLRDADGAALAREALRILLAELSALEMLH
jgi:transposase